MGLPGASGMSPPGIGAHWGSTRSLGAGARAGPASAGGVRSGDSPRSGPVVDPRRSVEILGAAKAPSVCAKTGWIQTSAADAAPIKNAPTDVIRVVLKASMALSSRERSRKPGIAVSGIVYAGIFTIGDVKFASTNRVLSIVTLLRSSFSSRRFRRSVCEDEMPRETSTSGLAATGSCE